MPELTPEDIEKIKKAITKKVADNIRRAREKKNITQTELAGMIQSDRQYLYKIESGKVGLSVTKLAVIAKALGVKMSDLV